MTKIRAKLAAIVLALATACALVALSPTGPAVAAVSPVYCDPPYKLWVIVFPNRTEYLCLPPGCTPIVCGPQSSRAALVGRHDAA